MIQKANRVHEIRGGTPRLIPGCIVFFILFRIGGVERGESTGAGADDGSL